MCLMELMDEVRRARVEVSEPKNRWAIKTGKIARPRVDGSLRFDFTAENVAEIAAHFTQANEARQAVIERFPNTVMFGDDARLIRQEEIVDSFAESEDGVCK